MGSLAHIVEDCAGVLQVFKDGSIFRLDETKIEFPKFRVIDDGSVIWKDCCYDNNNSLGLRLYKPKSGPTRKLPIVYFLHGGGFCLAARTWPSCHNTCIRLSSSLQSLVMAPDYRLAPEHRLPAAIDDGISAVKWLQTQALSESGDEWLTGDEVDFERVFVIGDSSGGNMAHHMAVQLGPGSPGMEPVQVRGYVMLAPFFGGIERTKSEAEGEPEPWLNIDMLDRFWRLSLPIGETRDNPLANPFGPKSPNLEPLKLDPMLVISGGNELMKDRVEHYANKLKAMGKKVEYVEFEGKQHGFFTNDPYSDVSERVLQLIMEFMLQNST